MDSTEANICREIAPQLDALHDGELQGADRAHVEKHLAICASCVNQLAEIDRLVHTLKTLPRLQAPAKLSADLDTLIERQGKVVPLAPRLWRPIAIAAAVIALVLGAKSLHGPSSNAPVTASNDNSQRAAIRPPASSPIALPQSSVAVKPHLQTPDSVVKHDPAAAPSVAMKPTKQSAARNEVIATQPTAHPFTAVTPKTLQKIEPMIQQQTPKVAVAKHAAGTQDEIAEVPSGSLNGFNDAVGIATDEDGLYDLKM